PAEIDALLERNPAVAEACVFGMADPISGEAIAAVRLTSGTTSSPESLQAWCRERLRREAESSKRAPAASISRQPKNGFLMTALDEPARGLPVVIFMPPASGDLPILRRWGATRGTKPAVGLRTKRVSVCTRGRARSGAIG